MHIYIIYYKNFFMKIIRNKIQYYILLFFSIFHAFNEISKFQIKKNYNINIFW